MACLSLNRPARHNSLIPELLEALLEALAALAAREPALRAAVLQAEGRSFSTGGDLAGFEAHLHHLQDYAHNLVGLLNQAILDLIALPLPVVAAVQGPVTGGSLGLVLACDIVLVSPQATFTPYYGGVGFSPDGGWTAMLPDLIGRQAAAALLLANHTLTARQAVARGLAQQVVPASQLRASAWRLAGEMAALQAGSLQRAKRLLWRDRDTLAARLEAERREFVDQIGRPETQRSMQAFLAQMRRPG